MEDAPPSAEDDFDEDDDDEVSDLSRELLRESFVECARLMKLRDFFGVTCGDVTEVSDE